jgi:hypothetical protein
VSRESSLFGLSQYDTPLVSKHTPVSSQGVDASTPSSTNTPGQCDVPPSMDAKDMAKSADNLAPTSAIHMVSVSGICISNMCWMGWYISQLAKSHCLRMAELQTGIALVDGCLTYTAELPLSISLVSFFFNYYLSTHWLLDAFTMTWPRSQDNMMASGEHSMVSSS